MEVIEQFIKGKRSDGSCEDGIIVTDQYVAVIDGSTSKSTLPPLPDGKTGGQVAMEVVREFVRTADREADMPSFCAEATARIRQTYHRYYDADIIKSMTDHPEDRFCCSAIVYSRHRNEVWMIGDCHALIISKIEGDKYLTNDKPYEARLAAKRSEKLKEALAGGADINELRRHDTGRDAILPELVKVMRDENIDYAVIDGFTIPLDKVKVYADVLSDSSELVLASDGYPRLYPTWEQTEQFLQHCLKDDPLFISICQETKGCMVGNDSFDDRTYIRIKR